MIKFFILSNFNLILSNLILIKPQISPFSFNIFEKNLSYWSKFNAKGKKQLKRAVQR